MKCSPSTAKRNTHLGVCCGSPGSDSRAALGIRSIEVVAVVPVDWGNQLTHWRQMQASVFVSITVPEYSLQHHFQGPLPLAHYSKENSWNP